MIATRSQLTPAAGEIVPFLTTTDCNQFLSRIQTSFPCRFLTTVADADWILQRVGGYPLAPNAPREPWYDARPPHGRAEGASARAARSHVPKTRDGVFLEQLETDPARFMPHVDEARLGGEVVKIPLRRENGFFPDLKAIDPAVADAFGLPCTRVDDLLD